MYLFDIHTHRAEPSLTEGYDVISVLNTYPSDFEELEKAGTNNYFSCGIHPWYSENWEQQYSLLEKIVKNEKVVAIGETGLDKLKGADMEIQIQVFRKHIELAGQYRKPLIIHCVKAWDELIALYKEYRASTPCWILHGYRGNVQQTASLSALGFYFSIGEKYNEDAVRTIPRESLFCETDMSDISVYNIYKNIALTLQMDINELVKMISININQSFCNV